jgi:hypothetical protein
VDPLASSLWDMEIFAAFLFVWDLYTFVYQAALALTLELNYNQLFADHSLS